MNEMKSIESNKKRDLLEELSIMDESKIKELMRNEISKKRDLPEPVASDLTRKRKELEHKSTDEIIDIAELELRRTGVTLYGHNGPINLTPLQHKFVVGYVKSGDIKEACRFAGIKAKKDEINRIGYGFLNDPKVAEAIAVMEKQHVLASGLTEIEVVAGIRDIVALARAKDKFGPALKGLAMLGDYLGMWEKEGGAKNSGSKQATAGVTINIDNFITSNEKNEMMSDVEKLASGLGIQLTTLKPNVLKDITAEVVINEEL